jgi:DNA topoisomerase I
MSIAMPSGGSVLSALPQKQLRKIHKSPELAAEAVGLVYVNCNTDPGYLRKKAGRGFYYVDKNGKKCQDKKVLQRIKALVIPPAWKDVWISKSAKAHLQATGIDEAGRKQYRYHEYWNQIRNRTKYFKLVRFVKILPELREQLQHDLRSRSLSCAKAAALAIRLIEKTSIRVGNQRYKILNGTSGLTTLDARHVQVQGSSIRFKFKGKKGIKHDIVLKDRSLARLVKQYKELPGRRLLQFTNEEGSRKNLQARHVNEYIQQYTGGNFSAKDFRTWMGTVTAFEYLCHLEEHKSETDLKRKLNACYDAVAEHLGNTRSVCKKYYVHPSGINAYCTNRLAGFATKKTEATSLLSESEQKVARLLATYTE